MKEEPKRDLFVLVADLDADKAIQGLLSRPTSLGIRAIDFNPEFDRLRYSKHDNGCCREAVNLLRPALATHRHALALFDRHGSGRDREPREAIESSIEDALSRNGWGDRARAIAIDPELENWVWGSSPHVATILGWDSPGSLHQFLLEKGLVAEDRNKPHDPKAAMEAALRKANIRKSSRHFEQLAKTVGNLSSCTDRAFQKLLSVLRTWFPQ